MKNKTLGNKLLELRIKSNITQSELANLLFVTNYTVSKWEKDIVCPDIDFLIKLSEIYKISVDELIKCYK